MCGADQDAQQGRPSGAGLAGDDAQARCGCFVVEPAGQVAQFLGAAGEVALVPVAVHRLGTAGTPELARVLVFRRTRPPRTLEALKHVIKHHDNEINSGSS
ncbi:hypothetical protein [Streptomyces sp. MMS24-I29]|uniref:hypothetical protein n=1 Tax=Streptomyces sp. MMS24-I29 TaxID=3351480 RepID=UPI003C79DB8F